MDPDRLADAPKGQQSEAAKLRAAEKAAEKVATAKRNAKKA